MRKIFFIGLIGTGLMFSRGIRAEQTSWEIELEHRLVLLADSLSQNLKEWKVPSTVFNVKD
ncbi:MAG: hypothetical protein LBM08_10970, partial [Dysgonamonadaceae bacterium]|nr:hypothetical protein [Dysgonamonadaceae bacterium]